MAADAVIYPFAVVHWHRGPDEGAYEWRDMLVEADALSRSAEVQIEVVMKAGFTRETRRSLDLITRIGRI